MYYKEMYNKMEADEADEEEEEKEEEEKGVMYVCVCSRRHGNR